MRLKLLSQGLHADIFGQADDLDRLDAVVGGGAQDALEQLLADAAAAIPVVDGKRRLGMDMAPNGACSLQIAWFERSSAAPTNSPPMNAP